MPRVPKFSFAGGELSPHLYGRVDIDRYTYGLRRCENFIILPEGSVRVRPGFRYLGQCKYPDRYARLVPFVFNQEQTYVLEFGHYYIRIWKDGQLIKIGGNPAEIETPYTEDDLRDLNFIQAADIVTLVHLKHPPAELRRYGDDDWQYVLISLAPTIAAPDGLQATPENTSDTPKRTYRYVVTAINNDTGEESLPSNIATAVDAFLATDTKGVNPSNINLSWNAVSGATHYGVYRDDGDGAFSFVGEATGQTTFRDNNFAPVQEENPPAAASYFQSAGNYPGAVTYFEQRLIFAGSENEPQTVWMSQAGVLKNFSAARNPRQSDSSKFTLASRKVCAVTQLVPLRKLLVLTNGSEWSLSGTEGVLTPTDIDSKCHSERGCANIPPLVVGSNVLYVTTNKRSMRDLGYRFESDSYDGQNLCIMAKHLFKNRTIAEIAHAAEPDSLVWVVMSDGALLSFTYEREHNVWAWSKHNSAGDFFESACVITEDGVDRLYAVVCRAVQGSFVRYLERLETYEKVDPKDYFFLDSGLTLDYRNHAGVLTIGGTEWTTDAQVDLDLAGAEWDMSYLNKCVALTDDAGCRYLIEIFAVASGTRAYGRLKRDLPEEFQNKPINAWDLAVKSLPGFFNHLEGRTVSVLADGNVHPSRTVQSGTIVLQEFASVIQCGLPIQSIIETLSLTTLEGPPRGITKLVRSVFVETHESRGIWVGETEDSLREAAPAMRKVYDGVRDYQPTVEVIIRSSWNTGGRIVVVQLDPLPLHILSVEPTVEIGR